MRVDELVEAFEILDDWEDRYALLIELGDALPAMPEVLKVPASRIEGCQSLVWLVTTLNADGTLHLIADSDARIVKGLIALLFAAFQDRPPAEVAAFDIEATFRKLGLDRHLSLNRRNGFAAMVQRIRHQAAHIGH